MATPTYDVTVSLITEQAIRLFRTELEQAAQGVKVSLGISDLPALADEVKKYFNQNPMSPPMFDVTNPHTRKELDQHLKALMDESQKTIDKMPNGALKVKAEADLKQVSQDINKWRDSFDANFEVKAGVTQASLDTLNQTLTTSIKDGLFKSLEAVTALNPYKVWVESGLASLKKMEAETNKTQKKMATNINKIWDSSTHAPTADVASAKAAPGATTEQKTDIDSVVTAMQGLATLQSDFASGSKTEEEFRRETADLLKTLVPLRERLSNLGPAAKPFLKTMDDVLVTGRELRESDLFTNAQVQTVEDVRVKMEALLQDVLDGKNIDFTKVTTELQAMGSAVPTDELEKLITIATEAEKVFQNTIDNTSGAEKAAAQAELTKVQTTLADLESKRTTARPTREVTDIAAMGADIDTEFTQNKTAMTKAEETIRAKQAAMPDLAGNESEDAVKARAAMGMLTAEFLHQRRVLDELYESYQNLQKKARDEPWFANSVTYVEQLTNIKTSIGTVSKVMEQTTPVVDKMAASFDRLEAAGKQVDEMRKKIKDMSDLARDITMTGVPLPRAFTNYITTLQGALEGLPNVAKGISSINDQFHKTTGLTKASADTLTRLKEVLGADFTKTVEGADGQLRKLGDVLKEAEQKSDKAVAAAMEDYLNEKTKGTTDPKQRKRLKEEERRKLTDTTNTDPELVAKRKELADLKQTTRDEHIAEGTAKADPSIKAELANTGADHAGGVLEKEMADFPNVMDGVGMMVSKVIQTITSQLMGRITGIISKIITFIATLPTVVLAILVAISLIATAIWKAWWSRMNQFQDAYLKQRLAGEKLITDLQIAGITHVHALRMEKLKAAGEVERERIKTARELETSRLTMNTADIAAQKLLNQLALERLKVQKEMAAIQKESELARKKSDKIREATAEDYKTRDEAKFEDNWGFRLVGAADSYDERGRKTDSSIRDEADSSGWTYTTKERSLKSLLTTASAARSVMMEEANGEVDAMITSYEEFTATIANSSTGGYSADLAQRIETFSKSQQQLAEEFARNQLLIGEAIVYSTSFQENVAAKRIRIDGTTGQYMTTLNGIDIALGKGATEAAAKFESIKNSSGQVVVQNVNALREKQKRQEVEAERLKKEAEAEGRVNALIQKRIELRAEMIKDLHATIESMAQSRGKDLMTNWKQTGTESQQAAATRLLSITQKAQYNTAASKYGTDGVELEALKRKQAVEEGQLSAKYALETAKTKELMDVEKQIATDLYALQRKNEQEMYSLTLQHEQKVFTTRIANEKAFREVGYKIQRRQLEAENLQADTYGKTKLEIELQLQLNTIADQFEKQRADIQAEADIRETAAKNEEEARFAQANAELAEKQAQALAEFNKQQVNEKYTLEVELMKSMHQRRLAEIEAEVRYEMELKKNLEKVQQAGEKTWIDYLNQHKDKADKLAMKQYKKEWGALTDEEKSNIAQGMSDRIADAKAKLEKDTEKYFNENQDKLAGGKFKGKKFGDLSAAEQDEIRAEQLKNAKAQADAKRKELQKKADEANAAVNDPTKKLVMDRLNDPRYKEAMGFVDQISKSLDKQIYDASTTKIAMSPGKGWFENISISDTSESDMSDAQRKMMADLSAREETGGFTVKDMAGQDVIMTIQDMQEALEKSSAKLRGATKWQTMWGDSDAKADPANQRLYEDAYNEQVHWKEAILKATRDVALSGTPDLSDAKLQEGKQAIKDKILSDDKYKGLQIDKEGQFVAGEVDNEMLATLDMLSEYSDASTLAIQAQTEIEKSLAEQTNKLLNEILKQSDKDAAATMKKSMDAEVQRTNALAKFTAEQAKTKDALKAQQDKESATSAAAREKDKDDKLNASTNRQYMKEEAAKRENAQKARADTLNADLTNMLGNRTRQKMDTDADFAISMATAKSGVDWQKAIIKRNREEQYNTDTLAMDARHRMEKEAYEKSGNVSEEGRAQLEQRQQTEKAALDNQKKVSEAIADSMGEVGSLRSLVSEGTGNKSGLEETWERIQQSAFGHVADPAADAVITMDRNMQLQHANLMSLLTLQLPQIAQGVSNGNGNLQLPQGLLNALAGRNAGNAAAANFVNQAGLAAGNAMGGRH